MTSIDPRALRDAFGAFLTGVTVVTARSTTGEAIGFTANSFASVSLDPPLLLVCLAKTSRNFGNLSSAKGFAVNILAENQKDVSNTFARPSEDRFATVGWTFGPFGSPVISDVAAWFDCSMHQIVDAGDHIILIGKVEAFENSTHNGLGYARGGYFTAELTDRAVAAAADSTLMAGALVERDGEILLIENDRGQLSLPEFAMSGPGWLDTYHAELSRVTGLPISMGMLYSVYEDRKTGLQHIVYRCTAGAGDAAHGQFFPSGSVPFDRLVSSATADVLRRYVEESMMGNFGLYIGNERSGQVHTLTGRN